MKKETSKLKPKEADRQRDENASRLSNKIIKTKPTGPVPFDYGISISLPDKGHILSPEGYKMSEEMMKYLFEKLEV